MEWDPTAKVDVLNVAFALADCSCAERRGSVLNVTVPVAAEGEIVAVKVTDEPNVDGFTDERHGERRVRLVDRLGLARRMCWD